MEFTVAPAFEYELTRAADMLTATARGPFDLIGFRRLVDAVSEACPGPGTTVVLLDITGIERPRSDFDRFLVGSYAAEKIGHRARIAILWHAAYINWLGENAAVNRGGVHRVFDDRDEAIAWLGGGAAAPGMLRPRNPEIISTGRRSQD